MAPRVTDESNIGIIYGLICVALTLFPWMFFDWLLHRNGHEYITTEVREALQASGWWGAVIVMVIGAILALALYHFFYQRTL